MQPRRRLWPQCSGEMRPTTASFCPSFTTLIPHQASGRRAGIIGFKELSTRRIAHRRHPPRVPQRLHQREGHRLLQRRRRGIPTSTALTASPPARYHRRARRAGFPFRRREGGRRPSTWTSPVTPRRRSCRTRGTGARRGRRSGDQEDRPSWMAYRRLPPANVFMNRPASSSRSRRRIE